MEELNTFDMILEALNRQPNEHFEIDSLSVDSLCGVFARVESKRCRAVALCLDEALFNIVKASVADHLSIDGKAALMRRGYIGWLFGVMICVVSLMPSRQLRVVGCQDDTGNTHVAWVDVKE